ncbi:hypothetical protein ABVT39_012995 [Epinephelus coioides]
MGMRSETDLRKKSWEERRVKIVTKAGSNIDILYYVVSFSDEQMQGANSRGCIYRLFYRCIDHPKEEFHVRLPLSTRRRQQKAVSQLKVNMLCSVEANGEGKGIDGENGCAKLLWHASDLSAAEWTQITANSAVSGEKDTEKEGEQALMDRKRQRGKRQREGGDSRLDHMTRSIVIRSEKGLERSISPSGQKMGETGRKAGTETEREREGATQRGSKQRERMRESIEQVPATSAPVGTTIKLPLDQPHTIYARTMHRSQRRK